MGRRNKDMVAGALVLALAAGSAVAQQASGNAASTTQAQQVPDAPRPQGLPRLNTIVPPAPNVPEPPAAEPTKPTDDNMGAPPPTSQLPSAPAATTAPDDQGPPPAVAETGQQAQEFVLHTRVNYVDVPFTVRDSKHNLVPGLTWRDVRVYENGARQRMAFWTTDASALSVAIVIDQSVTFDTMDKINRSLAALQGAFTPYDEVTLFTYSSGVRRQTEFTGAQSARLGVMLDRSKAQGRDPVMGLDGPLAHTMTVNGQNVPDASGRPNHGTTMTLTPEKEYHTLNDAILAAAQETTKAGKGRRRVVYVIGEGKEYGSKAKEKDVIRFLQTYNISLYATLVGDSSVPGIGFLDHIHLPLTMRDDVLPRYAAATGGEVDPEFRLRGIETSFAKLSETARTQYQLGYYSREPLIDGRYRSIEVRVMRSGLTVVAKPGYYPAPQSSTSGAASAASTPAKP